MSNQLCKHEANYYINKSRQQKPTLLLLFFFIWLVVFVFDFCFFRGDWRSEEGELRKAIRLTASFLTFNLLILSLIPLGRVGEWLCGTLLAEVKPQQLYTTPFLDTQILYEPSATGFVHSLEEELHTRKFSLLCISFLHLKLRGEYCLIPTTILYLMNIILPLLKVSWKPNVWMLQ